MSARDTLMQALNRARREAETYERQLLDADIASQHSNVDMQPPISSAAAMSDMHIGLGQYRRQITPTSHRSPDDSMSNWRDEHRRLFSPYPTTTVSTIFDYNCCTMCR